MPQTLRDIAKRLKVLEEQISHMDKNIQDYACTVIKDICHKYKLKYISGNGEWVCEIKIDRTCKETGETETVSISLDEELDSYMLHADDGWTILDQGPNFERFKKRQFDEYDISEGDTGRLVGAWVALYNFLADLQKLAEISGFAGNGYYMENAGEFNYMEERGEKDK